DRADCDRAAEPLRQFVADIACCEIAQAVIDTERVRQDQQRLLSRARQAVKDASAFGNRKRHPTVPPRASAREMLPRYLGMIPATAVPATPAAIQSSAASLLPGGEPRPDPS